jgi:hypothetical protein
MRINRGFFLQNNNCGYILKPPSMRNLDSTTVPFTIKIAIISGCMLPKPKKSKKGEIVDPFVVVKLRLPDKLQKGPDESYRTKVVDDNGFNPTWNTNLKSPHFFSFKNKVVMPELSFLILSVREQGPSH